MNIPAVEHMAQTLADGAVAESDKSLADLMNVAAFSLEAVSAHVAGNKMLAHIMCTESIVTLKRLYPRTFGQLKAVANA